MHLHYLTTLFKPRSIAVLGASDRPDAVGTVLLRNILSGGFRGPVYPVNPKYARVHGIKCHASLGDLPQAADLAVIATPAATVPAIVETMGQRGTKAAIVLSAGFREIGESGQALEERLLACARRFGVRLIGPNCIGVARPDIGLNATLSECQLEAGHLALVSHSGALCTAILDWALSNGVGFSSVVSTGNSVDIDFGEILDFLISDPKTKSILLYIEGIHHARRFMSALRAAARAKPVIVMKTGRHMEGSRAVLSHTGALVGHDEVFDAAVSRAGVVRVNSFADLFGAARTLSSGLRTAGHRLAIVTNGGGTGVMAADRLAYLGLPVVSLTTATTEALDQAMPSAWSHNNPVDIMGDAPPERYREAVAICLRDPGVDAVLVILTPQAMTRPESVAQEMVALAKESSKALLTCWMGEGQVESSRQLFSRHNIPSYRTPESAVDAFHILVAYHRNQELLLQVPEPLVREARPDLERARAIMARALIEGHGFLTEMQCKALLAAFHIPSSNRWRARSVGEAQRMANEIGFPVVLRVDSPDGSEVAELARARRYVCNAYDLQSAYYRLRASVQLRHPKARIEGVILEPLRQRRHGRELAIQVIQEPVFGPVITLGAASRATDISSDRAFALPPLNLYLARSLIQSTRIYPTLAAFHHLPAANMEHLEEVLLRVSEMVCELPQLRAAELNPVIVDEEGAVVAGFRFVVGESLPSEEAYAHMAIHPYPAHLMSTFHTADGAAIVLRPIRPEDAWLEQEFIRALSIRSKYFRFMSTVQDLTAAMLSRFTQIDYDREMALIAVTEVAGKEREIGVARYVINPDGESCEFAIVVADEWQGRGVGARLLSALLDTARAKRLKIVEGAVLRENQGMLRLMRKLGFQVSPSMEDKQILVVSKEL